MLDRSTGYNTVAKDTKENKDATLALLQVSRSKKDIDYRPLGLPRSKKVVVLLSPPRPNGRRSGGCARAGGGAKGGGCCRAKLEEPG